MSDLLNAKANAVAGELSKTKGLETVGTDHPFFDFLTQLLQKLLPLLLGCFATPKAAHAELQRPGLFTRWRLRFAVNQALRADDNDLVASQLRAAILKVGKDTTVEELTTLAADV